MVSPQRNVETEMTEPATLLRGNSADFILFCLSYSLNALALSIILTSKEIKTYQSLVILEGKYVLCVELFVLTDCRDWLQDSLEGSEDEAYLRGLANCVSATQLFLSFATGSFAADVRWHGPRAFSAAWLEVARRH